MPVVWQRLLARRRSGPPHAPEPTPGTTHRNSSRCARTITALSWLSDRTSECRFRGRWRGDISCVEARWPACRRHLCRRFESSAGVPQDGNRTDRAFASAVHPHRSTRRARPASAAGHRVRRVRGDGLPAFGRSPHVPADAPETGPGLLKATTSFGRNTFWS